jgi:hypothetical protein
MVFFIEAQSLYVLQRFGNLIANMKRLADALRDCEREFREHRISLAA